MLNNSNVSKIPASMVVIGIGEGSHPNFRNNVFVVVYKL